MSKETKAQRRRRYYIHYKLKKKGYKVRAAEKTVFMNHSETGNLKDIVQKYIDELKTLGYSIQLEI